MSIRAKKVSFKVKMPVDKDADPVEYKEMTLDVKTPIMQQINEAQKAYNRGLDFAITSKAPLRIEIEKILEQRGIWNDDSKAKFKELTEQLDTKVNLLKRGGMKLWDARKLAIEIRKLRNEIAALNRNRNALDASTAEAQAEQARFNFFVADCTYNPETGQKVFRDVEHYMEEAFEDYAQECAKQFGIIQYGLDADFEKKFPENQFLLKFKFVNDKLQLINRDGHTINEDGELVNAEGLRVDEQGRLYMHTYKQGRLW
jgi:hypothetical protein